MARLSLVFALASMACLQTGDSFPPPLDPGDSGVTFELPATIEFAPDGDTLHVIVAGNPESIRIKGIDTPEMNSDKPAVDPEPFAIAARSFALQAIGSQVGVEFDSGCPQPPLVNCRDPFARLLAYIRLTNGGDLGAQLLREGLARVFTAAGDFDRLSTYTALQSEAIANGVGLWE